MTQYLTNSNAHIKRQTATSIYKLSAIGGLISWIFYQED